MSFEHECPVWQYFAVLHDVRSVGVIGNEETCQRLTILRAAEGSDAGTADWTKLPCGILRRRLLADPAEMRGANRVVYGIPGRFGYHKEEWEMMNYARTN